MQKIGAQAITGCFRTVAATVAEAKASIRTVKERHAEKATRLRIGLRSLPRTHPLSRSGTDASRRFISSLQKVAAAHRDIPIEGVETIEPYALPPWEARLAIIGDTESSGAIEKANQMDGIRILTSISVRNGNVGAAGVISDSSLDREEAEHPSYAATLGPRTEQNPYFAELLTIAEGLGRLIRTPRGQEIRIVTSNWAAIQAIKRPQRQSGQKTIGMIYTEVRALRSLGNRVILIWVPGSANIPPPITSESRRKRCHGRRTTSE